MILTKKKKALLLSPSLYLYMEGTHREPKGKAGGGGGGVRIEGGMHREVIYETRATVFHRDIQTPRTELKIRRAAEYF